MNNASLQEKIEEENSRLELTHLLGGPWVVTRRDPSMPRIDVCCYLRAGAWDEIPGEYRRGTAHGLEHVIRWGAPEEGRLLDAVFEHRNFSAKTSFNHTAYAGSLPKESGLSALVSILKTLSNPRFLKAGYYVERGRIYLEWATRANDIALNQLTDAFGRSPMEVDLFGRRPASMFDIRIKDIEAFHHENYLANRMVVAAEGDVTHEDVVACVEKHIGFPYGAEPNKFDVPAYTGSDIRRSFVMPTPNTVHCSFGNPISVDPPSKREALLWFLTRKDETIISSFFIKGCLKEGLLYNYTLASRLFGSHPGGTTMFFRNGITFPGFVEKIVCLLREETEDFGVYPALEDGLHRMKSKEMTRFEGELGQPRGAFNLAVAQGTSIFDGAGQDYVNCDAAHRARMALTAKDVRDMFADMLCQPLTFRAMGVLKGLPNKNQLQRLWGAAP